MVKLVDTQHLKCCNPKGCGGSIPLWGTNLKYNNMKPFLLTESHQKKLLEMCNRLFPKYIYISFDEQDLDIGSPYGYEINQFRKSNNIFISKTEVPHDDGIFIHWYEFCMTYLVREIANSGKLFVHSKFPGYDSTDMLSEMIFSQEWIRGYHPIDFLYKYFKEL